MPLLDKVYEEKINDNINQNVIIEDDVGISYNSLIIPGVRIGKGSIIGARSVVMKDISPYSVYVRN